MELGGERSNDEVAVLAVVLVGAVTIVSAPGRFSLLTTAVGLALLFALNAYGRGINMDTWEKRLAFAGGFGLCVALIFGVLYQMPFSGDESLGGAAGVAWGVSTAIAFISLRYKKVQDALAPRP